MGAAYRGVGTDLEPVKRTLNFARVIDAASLPAKAVEWLLCGDYDQRLSELRVWLNQAGECATTLQDTLHLLRRLAGSPLGSADETGTRGSLTALMEYALAHPHDLFQWIQFLRIQLKSKEKGLDRLTTPAEAGILNPADLTAAFRFVFHNTLARSVFIEDPDLGQATGLTQELLREQFASSDKEAIRLYSARVAALLDKRAVPAGNQSGPVGT